MKAQMKCLTGRRSLFEGESDNFGGKRKEKTNNRLSVLKRGGSCAALIAILAISGYAGAGMQQEPRATAAPVVSRAEFKDDVSAMTLGEVAARYEEERKQEITLLDSVIDDPKTDEATRKSAKEQKLQIASRMETEAQIEAALALMGCTEAAAISGAGRITLFVSENDAEDDGQTVRILDAVSGVSGVDAGDVKIILVKK